MLKIDALGKAIVGAVALSGVATHAADWFRGYTFDGQVSGKIQLENEGWGKLPIELGDCAMNGQAGIRFAPVYGIDTSVQGIYAPFWTPYQTQLNDEITKKYGPTHHFLGVIGKANYGMTENTTFFGQFGIGGMTPAEWSDTCFTTVVGGGVNWNISGGFNWTILEYKHFNGWGEKRLNDFGTVSSGIKYNFS